MGLGDTWPAKRFELDNLQGNGLYPLCHQATEAGLAQYADVECKRLGSKNLKASDERTHPTLFSEGGRKKKRR